MEKSTEKTSKKVTKRKVDGERMQHPVTDKRPSRGTAELELKAKKEYDTEMAKQEEEVEKSILQSQTNGENDSKFDPEAGNNKPTNVSVGTVEFVDSNFESGSGYIPSEDVGTTKKAGVACAVCKFLNKECDSDCLNFHKLFDVSKIDEILLSLRRTNRDKRKVIKTMFYEANMRAKNPVGGCLRKMQDLQHDIKYYGTQLEHVRRKLESYCNSFPVVQDEKQDHLKATQMENSLRKPPTKSLAKKQSQSNTSGKNDSKSESDYPKIGSESGDIRFEGVRAQKLYRPACAPCNYYRRACPRNCLTRPYFPVDKRTDFILVHKVFGHRNILKLLEDQDLAASDKETAIQTMIFEANARTKDPVGGCYRMIQDIEREINSAEAELSLVLLQLELHHESSPVV